MNIQVPGFPKIEHPLLNETMKRKLHIGGTEPREGWELFNALPLAGLEHHGNANDLTRFKDSTFDEIYASHVVEHFDYKDELLKTLKEWFRVMHPGGKLYVSVPDLDILSTLLLRKDLLTLEERFFVMRMMFGGHVDEYDYHYVGLNQDFLGYFLSAAGFVNIRRVKDFNMFEDTSKMLYKGVNISLNVIAEKPADI